MELLEAIRTRRAIRRFKKEPVPAELIEKLLEAARWSVIRQLSALGIHRHHR